MPESVSPELLLWGGAGALVGAGVDSSSAGASAPAEEAAAAWAARLAAAASTNACNSSGDISLFFRARIGPV